jgi:hypothetical protein
VKQLGQINDNYHNLDIPLISRNLFNANSQFEEVKTMSEEARMNEYRQQVYSH